MSKTSMKHHLTFIDYRLHLAIVIGKETAHIEDDYKNSKQVFSGGRVFHIMYNKQLCDGCVHFLFQMT